MKLGLILPIACAAFIALVSPAPAAAQVQVCNSAKYPIVFAWSVVTPLSNAQGLPAGTTIIVQGWYSVASTACYRINDAVYTGQIFYFYGFEVGNPKIPAYTGTYLRCVGSIPNFPKINLSAGLPHFQYSGAQATPPCAAGEMQVGMTEFDIPYLQELSKQPFKGFGGTFTFYSGPNG